jgi:quinoprotein glucose dehydrogenase/quinate dehydrogenase (quinone)
MEQRAETHASRLRPGWLSVIGAILFLVIAAPLLVGGSKLIALGGSPYYLIAGLLLLGVAILIWRHHRGALWIYVAFLVGTILWSLGEVGFDGWQLLPRLAGPAVIGLWFAVPAIRRRLRSGPNWPGEAWATAALFAVSLILVLASLWMSRFEPVGPSRSLTEVVSNPTAWTAFGGDQSGSRFTTANLITPANAGQLEPAWTFRTGEIPPDYVPNGSHEFQSVPLKIGDALYLCTQNDTVISIDADTGKEIWRTKPKIDFRDRQARRCRSLSYHAAPGAGVCAQRLLMGTIDDQLVALDVKTGQLCPGFGNNGYVDLTPGLGRNPRGFHFVSSPPAIVRGVAVVGSLVYDNQTMDSVPGVIRAYDVTTGKLKWAWDVLSPTPAAEPGKGRNYARGGPNMWSVASADEALGLVFIPTANPANDFYGGTRPPGIDKFGSSIVALDAATGAVRWHFQTTHHDVWDYDVAAQPVLADFPTPGGMVPAVIAPTKRGEVFVLDRATGRPLVPVVEKPVPQGPPPGDFLSPTQPFVEGFPNFRPRLLRESAMWGMTPIDQLWCRIAFRKLRYDGMFTPNSLSGALHDPGSQGVINWGSLSVDRERRIAIVNSSWMPFVNTLIPRAIANAAGLTALGDPPLKPTGSPVPTFGKYSWPWPQAGTPYAVDTSPFLSPLSVPCTPPPWGMIAAIDLDSRKILWERPLGTSRGTAPLGLNLPVGVFNHGGSVTTGGGVTFIAATMDNYIRGFDTVTGRLLWQADLPAGGNSNPISYVSKRTGRQYVVLTAGGNSTMATPKGDYVVAFALPKSK